MGPQTSVDSPLRIDAVAVPSDRGQIGMTICPGKHGAGEHGTAWERDLSADLKVISEWGATALVTVMELSEKRKFGVTDLGVAATKSNLKWLHIPIADGAVPDNRFDDAWWRVAPTVLQYLRNGCKIVVHCRGGLGRTGLVVCLLLVEMDESPEQALKLVRAARPGTVETSQ